MGREHLELVAALAILLLEFCSSQVHGNTQIQDNHLSELISVTHQDEVLNLQVSEHDLLDNNGGVVSNSIKNLGKNSSQIKSVAKSNTRLYKDDENCGRVPIFERIYGKSINETAHKSKGKIEDKGEHRILYGASSAPGEWPWLAKIRILSAEGERDCTGSLLNDRWVITAAHCVEKASQAEVTLGLSDLVVRDKSAITIKCEKMIKHANATKTHNDIALLRLSKSIKFDNFIMPICLASGATVRSAKHREVKHFCHTIGFGLDENMGLPTKLQKLEIKEASCQGLVESVEHELPDVICVLPQAAKRGGTCQGDSGGPNVCYNPVVNRWNLVGLTSFGPFDCNLDESDPDGWLTGSMDLKKYRGWVANTIERHG